jgi:magnesium transporter
LTSLPPDNGVPPNGQEDDAKAAILEKVMKGRQPSDLLLRCKPQYDYLVTTR